MNYISECQIPESYPDIANSNNLKEFGMFNVGHLTEEEKTPPPFIVDGFLSVGLACLIGAPKTRKSFAAVQLASAVARGDPFLGFNTNQCGVCYFDLEGSKSRIFTRTSKMEKPVPDSVFITNEMKPIKVKSKEVIPSIGNGHIPDLINEIRTFHPEIKLFIFDTMARVLGSVSKELASTDAFRSEMNIYGPLERYAIENNICILLVHHTRKESPYEQDSFSKVSGTQALTASCDTILILTADGKRSTGNAFLECTGRDFEPKDLSLHFENSCCEWRIADTLQDIKGNPIANFAIEHCPAKGMNGIFFPYSYVYEESYHVSSNKASDLVKEQILDIKEKLFTDYSIAIQTGVRSSGDRGIRIVKI